MLSATTFWSFLREFSRLARSPSVGIIDQMVATTPTQRRYDHRLRDLVRTTGDIEHATRIGVPRSTARGWLTPTHTERVTLDVVDLNVLDLQQEVLRLRQRIAWLVAILRVLVVLIKVTGFSLERTRLPGGAKKYLLLRSIDHGPFFLCESSFASSTCRTRDTMRGSKKTHVASAMRLLVREPRRISSPNPRSRRLRRW